MTKKYRKLLFWLSTAIFFALAIPLMLYSFGYRIDLESGTWNMVEAGGLSIASVPATSVRIFVDGTFEHETSIFSRELFLQGLTPRKYRVRLERDGYHAWEKTLRVYPATVTRAEALLIPTDPLTKMLEGTYTRMELQSNDESALILTKPRASYELYDIEGATASSLPANRARSTATSTQSKSIRDFVASKKIEQFDHEPSRIVWWDDHSIWVKWLDGVAYLPTYTDTDEMKVATLGEAIRKVELYPNRDAIIVATQARVQIIELDGRDRHNATTIFEGSAPSILASETNELLFVLSGGQLYSMPLL